MLRPIDKIITTAGNIAAILTIIMALITTLVVIFRYVLGGGSIAWQESIHYLHSAIFLLGASAGLKYAAHVRVDIIFRRLSTTRKAWIDAVGTITLLLPLCVFMVLVSLEFVQTSWQIREVSTDAGGLPWVYLLKTLIPVGAVLLGLQALAELLNAVQQIFSGGNN